MSNNPLSQEASRRTNAARQRRWRCRQRAIKQATAQIEKELGREPSEAELYQELENRLEFLSVKPWRHQRITVQDDATATATVSLELMVASQLHDIFDML